MDWLSQNWGWIAFGAAFLALHLFGHRHGHARRAHQRATGAQRRTATPDDAHAGHDAPEAQNERRRRGC